MSAESTATNKPSDSPFKQQRLKAWQPILTPNWVVGTFVLIGIVFLPIGIALLSTSNSVVEQTVTYDDSENTKWCARGDDGLCAKGADNFDFQQVKNGQEGYLTFDIKKTMTKPVHLYYQLDNFYQNHRRYVKSRDDMQLRGIDNWKKKHKYTWDTSVKMDTATTAGGFTAPEVFKCSPLTLPDHISGKDCTWNSTTKYKNRDIPCKVMWPCGLIAGSFFNDFFTPLNQKDNTPLMTLKADGTYKITDPNWSEENIAWASDRSTKFKKPTVETAGWNYDDDVAKGVSSDYYHLSQMYPNFPNLKRDGVENEHFIVWMRTAGLPTFRKLYARIDETLEAGSTYTVKVNTGFNVTSFLGKKRLVLSTTSWMGGKNSFLGIAYIVVGSISLLLGVVFLVMDKIKPRKLGDTNYLVWS
jgi:hypothetical protein